MSKNHKMHQRDCKCQACACCVDMPWVELRLRVICDKCNKITLVGTRLYGGIGMQWAPGVYCDHCGVFIDIIEVLVGDIGVTTRDLVTSDQPKAES